MQTMGDKARRGRVDDSVDESPSPTDLATLPDAVRAVLEEFRAEVAAHSRKGEPSRSDSEELPYTCRVYESVPGEEELLQLQWMRIDMSEMDSERCWAEPSGCDEEHDCGPDSGLVLPAVYRVDPAQLFPLTFVGLPPELSRADRGSDGPRLLATDEVPEDHLCQIGRDLTGALATLTGRRGEGLPPDIVTEVASLAATDWSTCLERHVDFSRSDPAVAAQLLATRAPPTFDCLLGTVLPGLIACASSCGASKASDGKGKARRVENEGGERYDRNEMAIRAICRLAGSVAAAQGLDSLLFRARVSTSGLRNLGPLGREAEVAVAEAFFYGGSARPK